MIVHVKGTLGGRYLKSLFFADRAFVATAVSDMKTRLDGARLHLSFPQNHRRLESSRRASETQQN